MSGSRRSPRPRDRGIAVVGWGAAAAALALAPFGCFFTVADLEESQGNGGGGAGGNGNGGAGGSGNGGGAGGSSVTSSSGGGAPTCDAGGPCAPLLPSASFVLRTAGPGQCPAGAAALEYTGCNDHEQDCSCNTAGSGTCDIAASAHTSSVCTGGVGLTPANACNTGFNVGANSSDTTSASATLTVAGSLTCDPTPTEVPSDLEHGCLIEPVSDCGPAHVCLPPGTDDHCLLLPDGATCPPSYLTKRIVTTSDTPPACKCRCHECADVTVKVYEGEDCVGPSVTFLPELDGVCVATPFLALGSAYVPSASPAYCTAYARPATTALETLCCPD